MKCFSCIQLCHAAGILPRVARLFLFGNVLFSPDTSSLASASHLAFTADRIRTSFTASVRGVRPHMMHINLQQISHAEGNSLAVYIVPVDIVLNLPKDPQRHEKRSDAKVGETCTSPEHCLFYFLRFKIAQDICRTHHLNTVVYSALLSLKSHRTFASHITRTLSVV